MDASLAIRAEGLCKSYRLGVGAKTHATLRGTVICPRPTPAAA